MPFGMIARLISTLVAGGLGMAVMTAAYADEAGQREYMNACASCHGENGQGSGPMAEYMTIVVPPLTTLAKANDGAFPMQKVISVIDGRSDIRAHGSGMPVWGAIFADPLAATVTGRSENLVALGRILSIAYYLESIQE